MPEKMSEQEQLELEVFEKKLYSPPKTSEPFYRDSRNSLEGVPEPTIPIHHFDSGKEERIDIIRGQLVSPTRFEKLSPLTVKSPKIAFTQPKNFFKDLTDYAHGDREIKPNPNLEKDLLELAWRAFLAPNSLYEQRYAKEAVDHFLEVLSEKIGSMSATEFFESIKEKYAPTLGTRSRIWYPNLSARIKDQTFGRISDWLNPDRE